MSRLLIISLCLFIGGCGVDVRDTLVDCGGGHTDVNGVIWDWDCPRENYKCYEWGCQSLCKQEECKYYKREVECVYYTTNSSLPLFIDCNETVSPKP